jgi:hypothetical protein
MSRQHSFKFEYPNKPLTFSDREKFKNNSILNKINELRAAGITPTNQEIVNNNSSFFIVRFDI